MENSKIDMNVREKKWYRIKSHLYNVMEKVLKVRYEEKQTEIYLGIFLIDSREMQELNSTYRNQHKPTNVLSICCYEKINNLEVLGDIYLAYEVAKAESRIFNMSMAEYSSYLLVHGTLHLLGYDHIIEKDWIEMNKQEIKYCRKLEIRMPNEYME